MSETDVALDFGAAVESKDIIAQLAEVGDFPALSHVITHVSRIANSESSRTDELTDAILRDLSLTNKLLRVVNSAYFGQFGSRDINTVSRAIIILGFNTVRDAALSLMFFEHMQNHAQALELKVEAVDSFFCGMIGRTLAAKAGLHATEEALICSLFRNLGRMICRLHFYERAQVVDRLVAEQGLSEEAASRREFGISYDEISQALGRLWNLPDVLLHGMAPMPPGPIKANDEAGRLQALASMAHEVYQSIRVESRETLPKALSALGKKYSQAVAIQPETLAEVAYTSLDAMEKESHILDVDLKASPTLRHLIDERNKPHAPASPAIGGDETAQISGEREAEQAASDDSNFSDPTAVLISGLQDLTCLLLDNAKSSDLLNVTAELLYRAACFDNVVICSITANGRELVGRIGFGAQANSTKASLKIPTAFKPDVFHAAISKNVDLLISDAHAENIRDRIPDWYIKKINARSFLLLPVTINNHTVALIYADRRDTTLSLLPQALNLMKSLRNQVALALRQNG